MSGSKLRHTPHGRGPDDRDKPPVGVAYGVTGDAIRREFAADDPLNAPLPDSAEVAKEDRYWADIRERLERLLRDPDLSERTQAILESFDEQLTNRGFLTGNQVNTIIEIEDRRDSGKRRY